MQAIVLACQTGAGANPLNMCYTTGVGKRFPQHPMHEDSRVTNQTPPPGITVFDPHDPVKNKRYWGVNRVSPHTYPNIADWPAIEALWDIYGYPKACECTVQNDITPNAFAWGDLAAR